MKWSSVSVSFFVIFFAVSVQAQFFAESSYNLLHAECEQSAQKNQTSQLTQCLNGNNETVRINLIKKNMGEVSERAHLASLAKARSEFLDCTLSQLTDLQKNPDRMKEFVSDYSAKLTLLGHEKRIINELRSKPNRTETELNEYTRAMQRAQIILESLPFANLEPFQNVMSYVVSQYDSYTPDRLEGWLTKQTEKILTKAVSESVSYVDKNKAVMDQGVDTMAESLDDKARESLAQDTFLVESFRQNHLNLKKEIEPAACRVDAKYGKGAQYRDRALLGISILGTGASAVLAKLGAVGLSSSITGAAAVGSISIRSAGILRVLAAAGGTAAGLTQTHKACFSQSTDLSTGQSISDSSLLCESNILESQGSENCLLVSALNSLGIYSTAKGVKEALGKIKTGTVPNVKKAPVGRLRTNSSKPIQAAGLGRTPEVPKVLADQYPKLQAKLVDIGVTLRKTEIDGYPSPNAKKEMLERMAAYSANVSTKDKEAIQSVIDGLHDNKGWSEYAKQLTLDAATWISKNGSAAEKSTLLASGDISRRSMLVILAKRAADRGETLGKVTSPNEAKFFEQVRKGPFVDKGIDYNSAHGQVSHLIQMDYIAPRLESIYGKGSREFYKTVTENNNWSYLFDGYGYHFGSPLGITSILGKVLPVAGPK